ncbi:MAG TPA: acyl-CoA dehydrogenase family protein [Candidatus Obscuribacterales bacterium]
MTDQKVTSLPPLGNRYENDAALKQIISKLPPEAKKWAEPVLHEVGEISAEQLVALAQIANKQTPQLQPMDKFGNRVDHLEFHPAYIKLREASYGAGIIGNYYDPQVRKVLGDNNEIVKFAHGYLFSQAEQGLYCPICMTDGVAFLVEKYGTKQQKQEFIPHLTSRNLDELWEGAMFLTEKAGGSDVGAVETIAKPLGDGRYALFGKKWFCSNASAEAAAVLARVDENKRGTQALGLFLMRRHNGDGTLNNQTLERIKDKLGTRSMPTGELALNGAIAEPLGDLSRGFVQMADMLNLSRLYNATASVGVIRSVLSEALRYCQVRHTFGRPLLEYPLVQEKLVETAVQLEAALKTLFMVHGLRGKLLAGTASAQDHQMLRIMTPLLKYRTASLAVRSASDCLELHGGNGYIEDWPLARLYRDAQVLPVWEGTTNMMVLDTVRTMVKEKSHEALFDYVKSRLHDPKAQQSLKRLQDSVDSVIANSDIANIDLSAKLWCDRAFELVESATLMAEACDERSKKVADQFLLRNFGADSADVIEHTKRDFRTILGANVACMA